MLPKKKKIPKYTIDDIEIPSDPDEESSDKKKFDEKNLKKIVYIKMVNKYNQKHKKRLQKEAQERSKSFRRRKRQETKKDQRQK